MKKELKSGILSADKSADGRPTVGVVNVIAVLAQHYLSRVVRKPDFCICVNKDADQLRGNREADQCLCFRNTNSTIPLLSKSEI